MPAPDFSSAATSMSGQSFAQMSFSEWLSGLGRHGLLLVLGAIAAFCWLGCNDLGWQRSECAFVKVSSPRTAEIAISIVWQWLIFVVALIAAIMVAVVYQNGLLKQQLKDK